MKKVVFFIFLSQLLLNCANIKTYSILVCTSSSFTNAMDCKRKIVKDNNLEVFIVKDKDKKFRSYYGSFKSYDKAENTLTKVSSFIKNQKSLVKELSYDLENMNNKNPLFIDLNSLSEKSKNTNETTFAMKYLDELKSISLPKISENKNKRVTDNILKNEPSRNITLYDQLIIDVNSSTNTMILKGKLNNKIRNLQTYVVSTAKKDIKKPTGEGSVTAITLNPIWYPTQDTIESFKKRGIDLPAVVLPGNKYNYMGAAKISLSHIVDGKNTFRIHGTLSESTIGSNESSGCIRMKNNEVIELASLLNKFRDSKNIDNIKVYLK
jgi:lipoprotein-anchoring transpeptidase ErfK/SrfK